MATYDVQLQDKDGSYIATSLVETMAEAKKVAKHFLSDDYAKLCESTHKDMGSYKVEILRCSSGAVLWDAFL